MSIHAEWLSLIEVSGAFLAEPVLDDAFPQGLIKLDNKKKLFRDVYEEWREATDNADKQQSAIHQEWLNWVLKTGLEWDIDDEGEELKSGDSIPDTLSLTLPEHNLTLRPSHAFYTNNSEPYLLVMSYPADTQLNDAIAGDGWATSPAERMSQLCRKTKIRLGLVTNGEQWILVDAPEGGITSYGTWYARLWSQEPRTLEAFYSLLNIGSLFNGFGLEGLKLTALFEESIAHQDNVTETLGNQVQAAVELLIQSLDRLNKDSHGELLRGISDAELYESSLTYMMRLVFLLCAEERGLLLLGDETYEANYAVSTLRLKLREEAGLYGEEFLSVKKNAWTRLLSVFRAVYGGIEHESLRMPALGGSLFDPDRFPFLEGRNKDSNWKIDAAQPLAIDNRTVLLFLEAIQIYQGRTLSYRALDVEQIGYVYEGLLERTVIRTDDVTLELNATKSAKQPWVKLGELASAALEGDQSVINLLKERTGSSISRINNDHNKELSTTEQQNLLLACGNDQELRDQIQPYFHLLRTDALGNPMLYTKGAYMVATGADRRETGTHYTPKSLTEAIVLETLEPLVYRGPSEGKPRNDWQLKSPNEILALKICDPAMGSGAFLVQVCRYLSERLGEAWAIAEENGQCITADGEITDAAFVQDPLPKEAEERQVIARRLIAEHCLYGVDVNPLAVELAKLAIWLVTLSKGRPFGFLDHNLKAGNSLLGIHNLDQLYYLSMQPEGIASGGGAAKQLFAQGIEQAVKEALVLREEIRNRPVRDIRDIEVMAHLNNQAQAKLAMPDLIADALIGEALVNANKPNDLKAALTRLSVVAGSAINHPVEAQALKRQANITLAADIDNGIPRQPFHWPLSFPEVFARENGGFDAFVGNVPFLGGQRITDAMGTAFRDFLVYFIANEKRGSADLAAYFLLRLVMLQGYDSFLGVITTNTIAEGDTRQVGLEPILENELAKIITAYSSEQWPGKAAVVTTRIYLRRGCWKSGVKLNDKLVTHISAFLSDREEWSLKTLKENESQAFAGSSVLGLGFTLSEAEAGKMIALDSKNTEVLLPYLNGKDLNTNTNQAPSRWIINFFDWPEKKAKAYDIPYTQVLKKVKPERELLNQKNSDGRRRKENWWKYGRDSSSLYHAIGRGHSFEKHPKDWSPEQQPNERVLVSTRVTKHLMFSFIENSFVHDIAINTFNARSFFEFAVLQSSIHAAFVWKYASRLKRDLRYTPSDVYLPFPKPEIINSHNLEQLGETYHQLRSNIMGAEQIGLTKLYNRFHNPEDNHKDIIEMRSLHQKIDEEVALQYGWTDLNLEHGFYEEDYLPENDRIRFTISEEARHNVLDRLVLLNKERYAKEQLSKPIKAKSKPSQKPKKTAQPTPQIGLFDEPAVDTALNEPVEQKGNQWGTVSIDQILAWLESKAPNWYTKDAILTACGASQNDWDDAIKELLEDGDIESKNIDGITRYRAVDWG
jgi:hypothetical protein